MFPKKSIIKLTEQDVKQKLLSYFFWVAVFLGYSLLTLLLFNHRIGTFSTHFAMPDIDTEGGLWYEWFLVYIYKNDLIYDVINLTGYPFGFDLAFSPVTNLIYSIHVFVLEHIIGYSWSNLMLVTNISSFLVYPLAALGAALLCHYLIKNKPASIIAGLIFAFSYNCVLWGRGQMSINHIELIPFYLLSLFYFLDKRNIFSLLISVTLFAFMFKADAYYAFFSGIFSVIIILFYKKETLFEKLKTSLFYYVPLLVTWLLLNIHFILSNLYLFDKSQAVLSGRNSFPKNELYEILYYFSQPTNSILYHSLGNFSHIFNIFLVGIVLVGVIYMRRNKLFLLLFLSFLISLILSTYIPSTFWINTLYFDYFSMFRSVARITVLTSLFFGLLIAMCITLFMKSSIAVKYGKKLSYSVVAIMALISIIVTLNADVTWYKSTNFGHIAKLYDPIKNNPDIKAIAPYPMKLNGGNVGFPQTYQLLGQMIHEKPLANGVSPFSSLNGKYYAQVEDISNPRTIDALTRYGVDTIIVYNNFTHLKTPAKEINKQLKNDPRLAYIGRYTAPYDPGYSSIVDKSKDMNVYQIKQVVANNKVEKKQFYTASNNDISYTKLSAYKYIININNIKEKTTLIFDSPFSKKWSLIPGDLSGTNDALMLKEKEKSFSTHIIANEYANGWVIDPQDLKSKLPDSKITTNLDQSVNITTTLYFVPQSLQYIANIVSTTALFLIVLLLLFTMRHHFNFAYISEFIRVGLSMVFSYFKTIRQKNQNKDRNFMPFITGLRGYAALMVFLIHTGTFLGDYHPLLPKFIEIGKYGVVIFFVISAYTLCLSITRNENFNFTKYIKRRFMRIAPMYYVTMLFAFLMGGLLGLAQYYHKLFDFQYYDFTNLFYHLTFLNFFNQRYANSLVGVEWTIPLELFYYLIIPSIFFFTKKVKIGMIFLLLIGVIFYFNKDIHFPFYIIRVGNWSIEMFFATYCIGISAFFISTHFRKISFKEMISSNYFLLAAFMGLGTLLYTLGHLNTLSKLLWLSVFLVFVYMKYVKNNLLEQTKNKLLRGILSSVSIISLTVIFFVYVQSPVQAPELFLAVFTGVLIMACLEGGILVRSFFENSFILHIGKISYSFYLLHLIVVNVVGKFDIQNNFMNFFIILLITTLISTITQRYIEEPFIKTSKKNMTIDTKENKK